MTVIPNPVILTEASTSPSNKVGVTIYDNGESLVDNALRVRFVGLYQNGEEVGTITSNGSGIQYKGTTVLKIYFYSGYTFSFGLQRTTLSNGDYVAVVSYTKYDETKNYEVPIRIEVPRASIMKYQNELERASITKYGYELNLT